MIRVNVSEYFPITVALLDEGTGELAPGHEVSYDIRKQPGDLQLSPPMEGILTESIVEAGIYKSLVSIGAPGTYLIYATCSGFITNTEEVVVNEENILDAIKQIRHYNISVEDVPRTTQVSTASQAIRKVPKGRTDYVITRIKRDQDVDWSGAHVVEGRVYAWYLRDTDKIPYKMAGPE